MAVSLFNEQWYLAQNPDVARAVANGQGSAYEHFLLHGQHENRAPATLFDPVYYLARNPDVAAAVANGQGSAYEHFLLHGQSEPRAITPFLDLGAYLAANSDLAIEGLNLYQHLVTYGLHEGRDLGNGITLEQFANDPVFNAALADPARILDALARVAEVAPFLPSFQPPAGWTPAPDTPIPLDFVPLPGQLLVVPPTVIVPEGVVLPDTFKPIDEGGGGGSSSSSITILLSTDATDAHFAATITKGEVTLQPAAGDASLSDSLETPKFINLTGEALKTLSIKGDFGDAIADGRVLRFSDLGGTETGGGTSKVKTILLDLDSTDTTHQIHISISDYSHDHIGTSGLTSVTHNGATDLLGVTQINGSASSAGLNIDFSAFGLSSPMALKQLDTGSGNDTLKLATATLAGGNALTINTGSGDDKIILTGADTEERLLTFNSLGTLEADVSSLKAVNNYTWIAIEDIGTETTIKLANLDEDGNKGDLSSSVGVNTSNQFIALTGAASNYLGATLIVENMTLSSTWDYTYYVVPNDRIGLWGLGSSFDIISLSLSEGAAIGSTGNHFIDFTLEFDLDDDVGNGAEFTLVLKNLVSQGEYDNMLKALDVVAHASVTYPQDLIDPEFDLETAWDDLSFEVGEGFYNTYKWVGVTTGLDMTTDLFGGLMSILAGEGSLVMSIGPA
ncbi:hypothetical protein [Castellaniella defragrans]|uniref:Calcium-binding protein n=1 Tax=Castellaniella defragrans TaxID=75697 RepID=A0A7W9TJR3_CASDE|nr:hypothetical protein [Castellaniella defragrans]KAB0614903.1 hypothetical protein F7Q88_09460 [Castellaniella defragrans]MBB6081983.1 hypothetical protein [Castellaniella defragrans]